jgi:diguanylate cyclase (GGDEF)-like protein
MNVCPGDSKIAAQFQSGIKEVLNGNEKETELILQRAGQPGTVCTARFTALSAEGRRLITISLIDITEQREKEKQLEFLATHDPLTQLPNRALCRDRIESAISRARRKDSAFALVLLDIDDFKQINDAYGHITGDELIKEIGRRIKSCLRTVDTVARLGGDEFAVILEDLGSAVRVMPVISKLQAAHKNAVRIHEREITVSLSMGVCLFPQDGKNTDNLIRYADSALYHAKSKGKNTYSFYTHEMSSNIEQRLSLSHELRAAVQRNEFFLEYQPQVNVLTGMAECYEALIRWNHPEKGRMNPGEFLPVAEDTGIIKDIGDWVLYTVFKRYRQLQEEGITDIRLSLNVAGAQLIHGRVLRTLRELRRDIAVPDGSIEIELTENILFLDVRESAELVRELQALGLRVAMDDFGDGYSTLHHLTTLPLDVLKIDQKFARRILDESKNEAVVRGMAGIARDLGVDAVAEGIETKEQLDFFTSVGVGLIQGYFFSPPVAAELVGKQQFSV